jgi:ferredoxin-NADP reductase
VAGTAVQRRLIWLAAEAVSLVEETPRVRTIVFGCPGWSGHLAGQHVDIRLTAEDGYQAQRSYSLAAPADGDRVSITVELVDDGEVSPYLIEELRVGDSLELRGPIGGYFVWEPGGNEPLQLVGGGSGVVPLMAMIRARVASDTSQPVRLLNSARSYEDIIYRSELETLAHRVGGIDIVHTLTRSHPPGWQGLARRVDRDVLGRVACPPEASPLCFVCGPTGFVETVASALVELGHRPDMIRTERFGATGGPS